jgi:Cerato-platanin
MVSPAAFAFALFFTLAARALPQAPNQTPFCSSAPSPLRATYDTTFDNPSGSMNGVACSNGANGLAAQFPTFGDLPSFPFIGGAFDIAWNSPNCGACWSITNPATGVSIIITAIDTAGAGFNIAKEAFEKLTNGDIGSGAVTVVATQVSPSACGL